MRWIKCAKRLCVERGHDRGIVRRGGSRDDGAGLELRALYLLRRSPSYGQEICKAEVNTSLFAWPLSSPVLSSPAWRFSGRDDSLAVA